VGGDSEQRFARQSTRGRTVALTPIDKALLQRCLGKEPGAWNDFVDRYLGMFYHVIHYTSYLRSVTLGPEDVEDLAADILTQIVANDYAVLKQFRGNSSLATYLTVIARRIAARELARRKAAREVRPRSGLDVEAPSRTAPGIENLEEVQKLLRRLPTREREVVRLFYLEGRSYEEISTELHIPVNTIGPVLARAKKKLRDGSPAEQSANRSRHA
jgi:RNA polymerase sigma-70 factor (ECF subfamily)